MSLAMDLPKVIIKENYTDFLNGKEVEATMISQDVSVEKGMRVMGYHNSIAVNTGVSVPREKQSHYIGVEGKVTEIRSPATSGQRHPSVRVVKV